MTVECHFCITDDKQESLELLKEVVEERIRYYNFRRKHSALGHKSPIQYLKDKGKLTL